MSAASLLPSSTHGLSPWLRTSCLTSCEVASAPRGAHRHKHSAGKSLWMQDWPVGQLPSQAGKLLPHSGGGIGTQPKLIEHTSPAGHTQPAGMQARSHGVVAGQPRLNKHVPPAGHTQPGMQLSSHTAGGPGPSPGEQYVFAYRVSAAFSKMFAQSAPVPAP